MSDNQVSAVQPAPTVEFSFKQSAEPVKLQIDLDALTWKDNMRFASIQEKIDSGEMTQEDGLEAMAELLSKLVGQDIRTMPMRVVTAILEQFRKMAGIQAEDTKN